MAKQRKGLRAVLNEITHSPDRSPLFWWMVENHQELAGAAVGRRLQWTALCARFAELGLTDATGQVASERTARATWLRARKAVSEAKERRAARQETQRGKPASRMSPDWRPQEVAPPLRRPPDQFRDVERQVVVARPAAAAAVMVPDFPTVDATGSPLPPGYVFYRGKSVLRQVAEKLRSMHEAADEMDRFN